MNSSNQSCEPRILSPGEGEIVRAFGDEVIFQLTGEQTGGRLIVATLHAPPGGGPPPHYHENEDECFFVQEGRVSFWIQGEWREVPVGTTVYGPRNVPHTYKNIGDTPARMLMTATPSGFDIFFKRCAVEFARPGGPDMERIFAISAEHGIHYV